MPYFCEYPECRCHVIVDPCVTSFRIVLEEAADTYWYSTKEVKHKTFRFSNRNGADQFYLCDDCVTMLTELSTSDEDRIRRWFYTRTGR